jgi:hypothetical protein
VQRCNRKNASICLLISRVVSLSRIKSNACRAAWWFTEVTGKVAVQRCGQEAVDRFVQVRWFVEAGSGDEPRQVRREIVY